MKQATAFSIVLLLLIIVVLSQTAIDPEDFTGQWYSSNDQSVYLFQDGLIYCSKHVIPLSDTDSISGSYTYCRNSIYLFANGIDGLETAKEVYLVQRDDGSFLCENQDGTGEIYFIRYQY